ncbi:hypothetical protein [Flavobacterium sp. N1719]|uniref:hypothetical protein n=1 Tax=Flavobacterium sp. N1719 TaxID=2885633 RepID=UPI0022232D21|nr:hypothetical protein [Flavobacterium sp. N1719]
MLTVEEIRKNYKNFDDGKIKEIALNSKGLRREIIPILNEEIRNRNLDIQLIEWVNYETNKFKGLEKQNLLNKIAKLKCSMCLVNSNLHAYRFNTLISAFVTITDKTENLIICDQCANSKRLNTMLITFFFGWWSKKGILLTPFTLISDLIKIFRKNSESKKILDEFIENNTGILRIAIKENKLENFISEFNKENSR